jgi:hypothetical protein
MEQPEFKPRLIHNKRGVVIALCFTGYVSALSFRNVLWHSQRKHHWLLDLDWLAYLHFTLPAWAVAGVNLKFYACLFWGGVLLYRIAQGKERVLVVGGFAGIFLGLIGSAQEFVETRILGCFLKNDEFCFCDRHALCLKQ